MQRGRVIVAAAAVLALLGGPRARAEGVPGPTEPARFAVLHWDRDDGLPQSTVTDLVQDHLGYLWVTTFGGLARFDGHRLVVFDLARQGALAVNRFLTALEDPAGTLWLGTQERGVVRYRDGDFEAVPLPPSARHASVHDLALAPDGALWAASEAGLLRLSGDHAELVVPAPAPRVHARSLLVDGAGAVWANLPSGSLCQAGPCPPAGHDPFRGLPPETQRGQLALGPDGTRWLASSSGLWRADATGTTCAFARLDPDAFAARVALDPARDRVWFAQGAALFVRDGLAAPFRDLTATLVAALGTDYGPLRVLLVDAEGLLWIGTDRAGLVQLRDVPEGRYALREGRRADPANLVLTDPSGAVWAAQTCGPLDVRRAGGRFTPVDLPPPPPVPGREPLPPVACALALAPDGALWVASHEALYRLAPGAPPAFVRALPGAPLEVRALTLDPRGTAWVGTQGRGLLALPPAGPPRTWGAADGLGDDSVFAVVFAPDGALWLGTHAGVARLSGDTFTRITAADGLSPGTVRDILPDPDGTTWVGTYGGGLSRLRAGHVHRLTRDDGLCDNVVSRLLDDGAGALWMNGNRGAFTVRRADIAAYLDGGAPGPLPCALIALPEGNGGAQPAGARAPDGALWLPTIAGVVRVDPAHIVADPPPRVVLEAATLDSHPLALAPGAVNTPPVGPGDLAVRFTGLAFRAPHALRFRYRLVGRDDGWIDAADARDVNLFNLAPGDYRFEVEARNVSGALSAPAAVSFSVAPALVHTAWFRGTLLLLALALVFGLHRLRTRSVMNRNRTLQAEVAERERAEVHAREQQQHYRALFEGSAHGLFALDADGQLIEANAAALALVGVGVERLRTEGLVHRFTAGAREHIAAAQGLGPEGDPSPPVEAELRRPDGLSIGVSVKARRLARGGVPYLLVTVVDLSPIHRAEVQRRDYERRFERSQRLESLGLLAGGIAHDFNNHLTAVGSAAEAITQQATDPVMLQCSRDIATAVRDASALVSKLAIFGRQAPGGASDIDLGDLISDLAPILRSLLRADLAFRHVPCALTGLVRVDPVQLEQAVVNLVVNARDAMDPGGSVTIATDARDVDVDEAARHGVHPGRYAVVTVSDTGPGIPEAIQPRIFEPFFTTKPVGQGTGLGLAIVHAAVQHARGFVTIETAPGEGTRFTLHLPVVGTVERLARPVLAAVEAVVTPGVTLLVCDDHPLVRVTTARILRNRGYRVFEAEDAVAAMAALAREDGAVDLLLTDVVLPGDSGPELAVQAQARWPGLRVVLMSGYARDELDGVDPSWPFVRKPFATDAVLRAIERALLGREGRGGPPGRPPAGAPPS